MAGSIEALQSCDWWVSNQHQHQVQKRRQRRLQGSGNSGSALLIAEFIASRARLPPIVFKGILGNLRVGFV